MGLKLHNDIPQSYKDLTATKFNKTIKDLLCQEARYNLDEFFIS